MLRGHASSAHPRRSHNDSTLPSPTSRRVDDTHAAGPGQEKLHGIDAQESEVTLRSSSTMWTLSPGRTRRVAENAHARRHVHDVKTTEDDLRAMLELEDDVNDPLDSDDDEQLRQA